MPNALQLMGREFGKLTVVGEAGRSPHGKIKWLCRCACGKETEVVGSNLLSGNTTRCRECGNSGDKRATHGHTRGGKPSRAYIAWQNMRARCDPATTSKQHRKDYVGRGIVYDSAWETFEAFLADMGEPAEDGLSLDRRDNDGPYCKANCRWSDRETQRHNSRGVRWVTIKGERMILVDAVKRYGVVDYGTIVSRLHRGWSDEDAVLTPKSHRWSRRPKT
jgi:hypothetical protein